MPTVAAFDDKLPIVPYYKEDGNGFMTTLIQIKDRSAMHKACILIKHVIACGDGVIIKRKDGEQYVTNEALEAFLAKVNDKNESAEDVITKMLFDEIMTRMHTVAITLQTIGEGEEQRVIREELSVTHEDISTFRLGKPIENRLKECYLSYRWTTDLVKYDAKKLIDFAERLPLFDGEDYAKSVIYSTTYETGTYYYAIPDYFTLEFKRWADISYAIPTYNHSRIENQFRPSGMITFFGRPPEGQEPQDFAQDVQNRLTGEGNNSSILINIVEQKEQAPAVEIFDDAPEGIFESLSTLATESVLRAHRLHPSILMATAGSLGQASELKTIFELFYKNVIEGYQSSVLKTWDTILDYAGFAEYTLEIANNSPISLLNNIDLSNILSINEIREELGYAPLDTEQGQTKTLAEIIGVGGLQAMTAIVSDVELSDASKRGLLSVAFNLNAEQINSILPPLTPTV
jgi:hypothetical protein